MYTLIWRKLQWPCADPAEEMGDPWSGLEVGVSEGPARKRGGSHLPPYTLGESPVPASTQSPLPRAWVAAWTPLAAPPAGGALPPVSRWGRDGACALKGLHPHFLVAARGAVAGLLRGPRGRALSPGLSPVTWGRARQVPGGDLAAGLVGRPAQRTRSASREPGAAAPRVSCGDSRLASRSCFPPHAGLRGGEADGTAPLPASLAVLCASGRERNFTPGDSGAGVLYYL